MQKGKEGKERKEIKGIWIGKEEIKLSLLTDNVILYAENPKELDVKTTRISEFNKVIGYKFNIQKLIAFLYTNEQTKNNF